jgi:LmbE family N-acetylglucosaminyl deacetylase
MLARVVIGPDAAADLSWAPGPVWEPAPGGARSRLLDDGWSPGSRCRVLGVFAHPDDETFCAGGTFARYAEQGAEIMVVSATRGQAGQIRDAAAGTRRTIGAVREAELRLACERLGCSGTTRSTRTPSPTTRHPADDTRHDDHH